MREVGRCQAHRRCVNLWGKAANHPCANCGKPAKDWAYDGTDPTAQLGTGHNNDRVANDGSRRLAWYSSWPEFYKPLCRSCHTGHDRRAAALELHEYRAWRQRTGLTLAEVEELYVEQLDPRPGPQQVA